ncbi:MAG: radical SAM protein [Candidatus Eisenbacteria bacterium]
MKPSRVLLIRPPIHVRSLRYPAGPRFGVPISLLYLAAVLERDGTEVAIYDALVDFTWAGIEKNDAGNLHIGASWAALVTKVRDYGPQIVGITNPFSDFADYAIKAAQEIKKACPEVVTVLGGPHATVVPEAFLADGTGIDYVVRGEGEITLLNLVHALAGEGPVESIPGISYRARGGGAKGGGAQDPAAIVNNPAAPFITDLDDLPLPAYHLVPMEKYFELVRLGFPSRFTFEYPGCEREVSIITSRGCPFKCVYCGNHLHMGRRWRYNSVPHVLKHIELLTTRYGVNHIHIEDDNIGLDPARFESILDGIAERNWRITWDTSNGIRFEGLTPHLLKKMKDAGCAYVLLGIDSGNQGVLDRIIGKRLDLGNVVETVRTCKRLNLDAHGLYVVGFPGETRKEIEDTFNFAKMILKGFDVVPHLCLARPLPGTDLNDICEEQGYLTEPVLPEIGSEYRTEIYPRVMIKTEWFTPQDLERWVARFNRQVITIIIAKSLWWLVTRPQVVPSVTRKFVHDLHRGFADSVKRMFFGGLLFKFNYLSPNLRKKFTGRSLAAWKQAGRSGSSGRSEEPR